jgi:hypothetical protein
MAKYLGQVEVEQKDTPYRKFEKDDWAMLFIGKYGGIDGDHHKTWVLDQVARILKGTPVVINLAKWARDMLGEYDEETGTYEYDYDCGIAP